MTIKGHGLDTYAILYILIQGHDHETITTNTIIMYVTRSWSGNVYCRISERAASTIIR